MSSEPKESKPADRLPFEPARKKADKPKATSPSAPGKAEKSAKKSASRSTSQQSTAIPEVVSRRMARRMAIFCGIPTTFGMLTFIVSYLVVTQGWFKLPTVAVLLTSMGFFGLGVLGLSYGIFSASWDEDRVGSLWGAEEFSTNFGRTIDAWKSARQQKPQD